MLSGTQKTPNLLLLTCCLGRASTGFRPFVFFGLLLVCQFVHGSSLLLTVNAISTSAWGSHWPGGFANGDLQTQSPRLSLFGTLTVPILNSQLQDTQAFQMQSYWHTWENKWCRHQGIKDGTTFLLVLILKIRAVFFLLLSCAQSYISISQVNSTFRWGAFCWCYKGSCFSAYKLFLKGISC